MKSDGNRPRRRVPAKAADRLVPAPDDPPQVLKLTTLESADISRSSAGLRDLLTFEPTDGTTRRSSSGCPFVVHRVTLPDEETDGRYTPPQSEWRRAFVRDRFRRYRAHLAPIRDLVRYYRRLPVLPEGRTHRLRNRFVLRLVRPSKRKRSATKIADIDDEFLHVSRLRGLLVLGDVSSVSTNGA